MAVSVADMNQIRVNVLGTTVDAPGAAWTTAPPAAANTLNTAQRIVTRAINELNTNVGNALNGTVGFDSRFNGVIGNEEAGDQAAFAAIGSNLIQAVAALVAGGVTPGVLSLVFPFPDPLTTNDYVDVAVDVDCTIAADLADTEYSGGPQPDDMHFELTEQPSGDVVGEITVAAGNIVTLSGLGGEVTAGTSLRMTAVDIVGGTVSPTAVITVTAARKAAPPPTTGRFEFTQPTPEDEWEVYHSLNQRIVSVQIIDDSGRPVLAEVDFDTVNRCIITFAKPKAGTAVVRR